MNETLTPPPFERVAVVGAGSWGTALASLLAQKLPRVTLWCREPEVADGIRRDRHNPLFVSDLELPPNLETTTDLPGVVRDHQLLVMVIPTQFTRAILKQIKPHVSGNNIFVSASKGVEVSSLTLISDLYTDVLGEGIDQRCCFLSGPSFARDVIGKLPAAVAIAGRNESVTESVQNLFFTSFFRTYRTNDVIGVELGGALKNVIALAAGICDGLGFGHSARAALITRGLAEITRLGVDMGGVPETFAGLSGMGDLLLTATSPLSRNRTVGFRIGSGESLEQIQQGNREVAEGVKTTISVHRLAQQRNIEMPITDAVFKILYEGYSARDVVGDLMSRALKPENPRF